MWMPYAVTGIALIVVATIGAKATDVGPWYQSLRKPKWNPPNWSFGVIWTFIYLCILASVGIAWNRATEDQQSTLLWVTAVNFIFNALWSVVFFKWKLLGWALIECVFLWVSIVVIILAVFPYSATSGWLLFPYIVWVTIAFLLNTSIYLKNKPAPTE